MDLFEAGEQLRQTNDGILFPPPCLALKLGPSENDPQSTMRCSRHASYDDPDF